MKLNQSIPTALWPHKGAGGFYFITTPLPVDRRKTVSKAHYVAGTHMLPKGPNICQTLTLKLDVWRLFARSRANLTLPALSSHHDLPRAKFAAPGVRC